MKALAWHGKGDIRCEEVPDPKIEHPRDAIIKVTACAICGSDLHIYGGIIPDMKKGDVLGHENMGEVVEVGSENKALKAGDRVVVPFTISCGECFFCRNGFYSGCERTNPDHEKAAKLWGNSPAGLFGYSHLLGGYAGGQAEYLRVPYADVGPIKVPGNLRDEQVLFLSDIFPTGYMAADFCNLKGGETVAIWGCGPVGQFAIRSAFLLGAERVLAIDTVTERLDLARQAGAETIDFMKEDVYDRIMEFTKGRGADACIDAVGTEAAPMASADSMLDRVKTATFMGTDRPHVLRQRFTAAAGATETEFFRRADMLDTKVGTDKKDDPAAVAKDGFKAMMSGEGGVVSGWQNRLEAAAAHVISSERLAKKHSEMAAPGTAKK